MIESVLFRPEAEAELQDAYQWYESHRKGLGEEFLACVDAVVSQLRRYPELYPVVHGQVRRALTRRFPYGVFYIVEANTAVVLAVFHSSRDPKVVTKRSG